MRWRGLWTISKPGVTAAVLLGLLACGVQENEPDAPDLMGILPSHLAGWTLEDSTVAYDRETIFDYINGAGEVYRSYAFSEVVVARYSAAERSDVLIELFDMGTEADAYGVFSYAREQEETGIGGGYEHKGDVLCFWQNRYYLCLVLDDPTLGTDTSLVEMATALSGLLPESSERPDLVGMLPDDGLLPNSARFFHLHQSLNYHYYLARDNLLNLGPGTDVVFARYEPGDVFLMIARYESDRTATEALASFKGGYMPEAGDADAFMTENGKFVASSQTGRHVVVVLDAESDQSATDLMRAAAEKISAPTH